MYEPDATYMTLVTVGSETIVETCRAFTDGQGFITSAQRDRHHQIIDYNNSAVDPL